MADRGVLLVEGKDDEHVLDHLLGHYQVPEQFRIVEQGGIEKLLESSPVQLKASDVERIGVVVDANTDLGARWQALGNILLQAGYNGVPVRPDPDGTMVEQEDMTVVGIWLMPDNHVPGMLEDFCRFLVPHGDPLWGRAAECLGQIPETERRFVPGDWSTAHIHTWLAWQKKPGRPLGTAITARYLNADAPHAQRLMDWVRLLFDL